MILVDSALAAREADGRPIRVGMVGAGFMGQGLRPAILYLVAVMIVGTALALRLAAPVPGDAPYSSLSIARGSPGDGRIAVEVVNREGTTVLYRLQLELDGRLIGSETSALPDGGRWDYIPHTIVAPGQRVEVQLFRSPNLMTLYRDVNATVGPDW